MLMKYSTLAAAGRYAITLPVNRSDGVRASGAVEKGGEGVVRLCQEYGMSDCA